MTAVIGPDVDRIAIGQSQRIGLQPELQGTGQFTVIGAARNRTRPGRTRRGCRRIRIRPHGPISNPLDQIGDLSLGQLAIGRHLETALVSHGLNDQAFIWPGGNHSRTGLATFPRGGQ